MKKIIWYLLGFLLLFTFGSAEAQTRNANTPKFFVTALEHFETPSKTLTQKFGPYGDLSYRYWKLDTALVLGMNAEWREFWDVSIDTSSFPVPPDTVVGGPTAPSLDAIILEPYELKTALEAAVIVRFESERHTKGDDTSEYFGFLHHSGLIGLDTFDIDGTSPKFLIGSPRSVDTIHNVVKVRTSVDPAGIIGDSVWENQVVYVGGRSSAWNKDVGPAHRLLLRFRVRVDTSGIDTTAGIGLFSIKVVQKHGLDTTETTVLNDTVKIDSRFIHFPTGFDLIDVPFLGIPYDTISTYFKVTWLGNTPATFDYMELMSGEPHVGDQIGYGENNYYSYESLTANNDLLLRRRLDTLYHYYAGKAQYIMTAEEWHFSDARIIKRAEKLLQNSGGAITITSFFQDSTEQEPAGSFYGYGIPNQHTYDLEGVRLGWLDSSKYADPKFFWYENYPWGWQTALPKRSALPLSAYRSWETKHEPTSMDSDTTYCHPYDRASYLNSAQFLMKNFLSAMRRSKRTCVRNESIHQRFGASIQAGGGVGRSGDSGHYHLIFGGGGGGLRAITAPELKIQAHLSVSSGASALLFYMFGNPKTSSSNGGLVDWNGAHSEMIHVFRDTVSGTPIADSLYMGWKENFDSAKILIRTVRKYGEALFNAKFIGDWTAAELHNYPLRDSLPFRDTIATLDDSLRKDAFKINNPSGNIADTTNRTFVHISMWRDTNSSAVLNHSDTLLYITNMRTDDSYDTTEVPTTIDRRLITMRMKGRHLVQDILDTNGYLALDNQRIWTPYVGAGDSLRILLLPGDGILVRLLPGPDSMKQMRVAMNFPKGTQDFNDYGRVNFDKPVKGVKNPTVPSQYSVPSSRYSYIGIRDADTVKLWQDSLLYLKVDNAEKTRSGKWRNQNWTKGNGGAGNVLFNFRETLGPSIIRDKQTSFDSLAHHIVIKTDLEGTSSNGKIRLKDPFLVDSATLKNVNDTLPKSSPFLPHVLNTGRGLGVDSEHYGGIFLKQNASRDTTTPIYALNAFSRIIPGTFAVSDSLPGYTDWSFLEWTTNDTIIPGDTLAWFSDPDSAKVLFSKDPGIVFGKDSAIYIARYKAHMSAYTESGTPDDSGNCCNNQRKLFYIGKDSIGRRMFRFVYSSGGRIYTAIGTKTGNANVDIVWKPEQLLSSWNSNHSHYPAVGYHTTRPEHYHYVYEDDNAGKIKLALLDTSGALHAINISDMDDYNFATPAISSVDFTSDPIDIVGWSTSSAGIHFRAISWTGGTPALSSVITVGVGKHAKYPTIWVDSCDTCSAGYSRSRLWTAWQQDTTITVSYTMDMHGHLIPHDSTITDVFAEEFQVDDSLHGTPVLHPLGPFDVSRKLNFPSFQNQRPCITGVHRKTNWFDWKQIKLAYETLYSPDSIRRQGIEIADYSYTSSGWTNTNFLTSADTTNPYWKPSIEVSKYHKADTGLVEHQKWYSVVHEIEQGVDIQHWAFDGTTQRVTSQINLGLQDPQIAMTPSKIDSDLYRMAISHGGSEPRWMIPGFWGTYKIGTNDSLWGYHTLTEQDTSTSLLIESGYGELATDNGSGMIPFDLADRDEALQIDTLHSKDYFMQSSVFTLPSGGSLQYCYWIRPSDNVLYASRFDTLQYALDFYDTSGVFQLRVDSMVICDSVPRIYPALRNVSIGTESNQKGYVVFHRVTGAMNDTAAIPQSIISSRRYSGASDSYKKGNTNQLASGQSGITLTASPNPFKKEVNIYLTIPSSAPVTIEAFNALGNSMGYLCKEKTFTEGKHELHWNPGKLPTGVYILRMQYGNEVISVSVVAME